MKKNDLYQTPYEEYKELIKQTIHRDTDRLRNRKIAVFGVSGISSHVVSVLNDLGYNVDAVLENDHRWIGKQWLRIRVISPNDLKEEKDWIIISCTPYVADKKRQLMNLGQTEDNCLFIIPRKDSLVKRILLVREGLKALSTLRKQYGECFFLCPYPGTGDAFLTGRYLPNLVKKLGWEKYTILVTGGAFKKVMGLYGYNNCVSIDKKTCEDLKRLISFYGEERLRIKYLLMWGLSTQTAVRMEGKLSFNDFFKYTVFGGCDEKVYRPVFPKDEEKTSEIMLKHGLIPGKSVILVPYANSFEEELDSAWWSRLTEKLKENGYTVATNCGTEKEKEIEGSVKLVLPYSDFASVAERCGFIVGVRNGLFDLMSEIDCKKIILYQNFIRKDRADSFKLNNMGLCDDAIEFDIDLSEEGIEILKEKICKSILNESRRDKSNE